MAREAGEIISVSVPRSVIAWLDEMGAKEDRSRSSVIRRAIIEYKMKTLPQVNPEPGEVAAMKAALKDVRKGNFVTLAQLRKEHGMDRHRRKKSKKAVRKSR